jgi:hypothetical protein
MAKTSLNLKLLEDLGCGQQFFRADAMAVSRRRGCELIDPRHFLYVSSGGSIGMNPRNGGIQSEDPAHRARVPARQARNWP